jgi:hypothetical protein
MIKLATKILEYTALTDTKTKRTLPDNTDHIHDYKVDTNGDGYTTFTSNNADNHIHKIVNFKVQLAKGHTHEI